MGFDLVDVADLEPGGPGGMVRFVRKALGARAFGVNYFTLPPGQEGVSTTMPTPAKRRSTSSLEAPGEC